MPQLADLDFWDQIDDYDCTIISIFKERNILSHYLEHYPNRENKDIIDFGCGTGNAIPFISGFKKIYAVDYSSNMLNKAKERHGRLGNIEFIEGNLMTVRIRPVDVILASSSVWPQSNGDFHKIIQNFLRNIKPDGEIIMVLPSFEAATCFCQMKIDHLASAGTPIDELKNLLASFQITTNYNPLGYLKMGALVQKYWLKEEILYRLIPFKFNSVVIEKLELNWGTQMFHPDLEEFPKSWFWMVRINI